MNNVSLNMLLRVCYSVTERFCYMSFVRLKPPQRFWPHDGEMWQIGFPKDTGTCLRSIGSRT